MRTDQHINLPISERSQQLPPLGSLGVARQQRDPQAKRPQKRLQIFVMLPGEDFRRRHQRPLKTGATIFVQSRRRNSRLARANIPLHQPPHWARALHVSVNLRNHALLRPSQREGQSRTKFRKLPAARLALHTLHRIRQAVRQDGQLRYQQFLVGKALPPALRVLRALREMHAIKRVMQRNQRILRQNLRRQALHNVRRVLLPRRRHQLAHTLLREIRRQSVNRQDCAPARLVGGLILVNKFVIHDRKLAIAETPLQLAVNLKFFADNHFRFQMRLVVPNSRYVVRAVAKQNLHYAKTLVRAHGRLAQNSPANDDRLALIRHAHRHRLRAALIIPRIVEKQIRNGVNAQTPQQHSALRTNALQIFDGNPQRVRLRRGRCRLRSRNLQRPIAQARVSLPPQPRACRQRSVRVRLAQFPQNCLRRSGLHLAGQGTQPLPEAAENTAVQIALPLFRPKHGFNFSGHVRHFNTSNM